jgi:hypothetical protein
MVGAARGALTGVGEKSRHNELDASSRASLAHNVILRAANEDVRKGATQLRNPSNTSTLLHTHSVIAFKFELEKKPEEVQFKSKNS